MSTLLPGAQELLRGLKAHNIASGSDGIRFGTYNYTVLLIAGIWVIMMSFINGSGWIATENEFEFDVANFLAYIIDRKLALLC